MRGIEEFRYFTVKVEKGSGCLFQPYSKEYTYVLTAKHVIKDKENLVIILKTLDASNTLCNETLEVIGEPYLHPDDNIDAAIIKVVKVDGVRPLLRLDNFFKEPDDYYLCGYPDSRKDNDGYRQNKLSILNPKDLGYIEGEFDKPASHDEVVGQSGGGILKCLSGIYYISGIQKRMSALEKYELLGRIDFMPLSFFDEIIDLNPEVLNKLDPPYITSFSELIDKTYYLEDLSIRSKGIIKSELHGIASELCDEFSPEKVITLCEKPFLVKGELLDNVYSSKLWIGFLELLIANQIQSTVPLELADIKSINKKNRLFFGSVERKWTEIIDNLFLSDLSEIEKGGSIFVVTSTDNMPTLTELKPMVIADISQVSPREMTINSTVLSPSEDIKIKHIYSLQKHIIDNGDSFVNANTTNVASVIKHGTKNII